MESHQTNVSHICHYNSLTKPSSYHFFFQAQFWDICLLIFILGIYKFIFKDGFFKIEQEKNSDNLRFAIGLLKLYDLFLCLMTFLMFIKLLAFVFLIRYHETCLLVANFDALPWPEFWRWNFLVFTSSCMWSLVYEKIIHIGQIVDPAML